MPNINWCAVAIIVVIYTLGKAFMKGFIQQYVKDLKAGKHK